MCGDDSVIGIFIIADCASVAAFATLAVGDDRGDDDGMADYERLRSMLMTCHSKPNFRLRLELGLVARLA